MAGRTEGPVPAGAFSTTMKKDHETGAAIEYGTFTTKKRGGIRGKRSPRDRIDAGGMGKTTWEETSSAMKMSALERLVGIKKKAQS